MTENTLELPLLGMGTAPLGGLYKTLSDEEAVEVIRFCLESRVNFFDTAPLYGAGVSETRLGLALEGEPRSSFTLATKVGYLLNAEQKIEVDLSRDGILRSLEGSFKRLKTDRLDIVHIHEPPLNVLNSEDFKKVALAEVFPLLTDLRAQGTIKAIGAGLNQWELLDEFADEADFDCFLLAGRYTLLHQGAIGLLDKCQQKGIKVFLGGVFNSGILATGAIPGAKFNYRDAPPEIMERVRQIETVCARYQVPIDAVALQFPLAHPAVTSLVVGVESIPQVEGNLAALARNIPVELWSDLKAEGLIDRVVPTP
ncbi:MAG: aldo/keto reductase [Chloroflexi bacterium]|nr:aldo/keto reductase [Chloroflexota bacterium]OJV91896.1 MAG: hypothetical protein BGO39_14315 [Chloroflexi bacterium 54-19]